MQEIERKFKVENFAAILRGFEFGVPFTTHDKYFLHPLAWVERGFGGRGSYMKNPVQFRWGDDKWLRIRYLDPKDGGVPDNPFVITHKGPREGARRLEVEVGCDTDPLSLLEHLGFRHFLTLSKTRTKTRTEGPWPMTICLDEVDELGNFVEIERLVEEGESWDGAEMMVDGMALQLGLENPIHKGYAQMLLDLHPESLGR